MQLYLNVKYGQDVPAYYKLDVTVELPDGLIQDPKRPTARELEQPEVVAAVIAAAKEASENARDHGKFVPAWDGSTGLRVTDISDNTSGYTIAEDIALEFSGEDLGLVAKHVLEGVAQPQALLFEAERQGIEVSPAVRKLLSPPSQGH
jgi:hypothetical protein